MAKTSGSERAGKQGIQATSVSKIEANSEPSRTGSENRGSWIDEYGRTCYGNECFQMAIDETRREIVVNVKPNSECNIGPVIEALRKTLGEGARTVYEVESESRETK